MGKEYRKKFENMPLTLDPLGHMYSADLHDQVVKVFTLINDDHIDRLLGLTSDGGELIEAVSEKITTVPSMKEADDAKDMVNNPDHYTDLPVEVIDMMFFMWGIDKFVAHCEMTAFKYRMRAGKKDDAAQDLEKADKHIWFRNNVLKGYLPTGAEYV